MAVPTDGGAPYVLAEPDPEQVQDTEVRDLAYDDGFLYWSVTYKIWRASAAGGAPQDLVGNSVYFWTPALAVGPEAVYFPDWQEFGLLSVPKAGGSVDGRCTSGAHWDVAFGGNTVFFGDSQGNIRAAATDEAGGCPVLATLPYELDRLAVGGDTVYGANRDGPALWAIPRAGDAPVELATDVAPDDVVADEAHVYWSQCDKGNV
jgi:hypothetical protein